MERYLESDEDMEDFLIDAGTLDVKLERLSEGKKDRVWEKEELKDLVKELSGLEKLKKSARRRGLDVSRYIELRTKDPKDIPIFKVESESKEYFLYSKKEMDELMKEEEKKKAKAKPPPKGGVPPEAGKEEEIEEVTITKAEKLPEVIQMEEAMHKVEKRGVRIMGDKVEPRRQFIQEHAPEVKNLDI